MIKKILRWTLLGGFAVLFIYTLYFLYEKNAEPDVVFETIETEIATVINETVATGAVIPRREIEIKPQVSGIIQSIEVEAGDMVKKGQTIARVTVIPDMINLNNAENRVKRAELEYKNAKNDFDRYSMLFKNDVIAQEEYQDYELAFANAGQELEAAKDNLHIIKEGISLKSGSLSNTIIRSTIDGMILDVPVEVGNSVIEANNFNEGTTIANVANLSDMIFEGKVDESEVGKIKPGMSINLSIGALEGHSIKAILEFISPKGIEENGAVQFEIRAAIETDTSVFIRAGYSANANIVLEQKDSVLTIKESVLQFENDSVFVELETGEQLFEKIPVELGLSDGIKVQILEGLALGDKVKVPQEGKAD